MNDLLIESIKTLPFAIQPIFILLLFMPSFVTKTIMPITSFFSKKIFNRTKNRLSEIISNKDLDKALISESEKELSVISKMNLTESRDRWLALYFYELTNISKHIISYNQFKKLYKYLSFEGKNIFIDKNKMKRLTIYNCLLMIYCFLLTILLLYVCFSAEKLNNFTDYQYLFCGSSALFFEFLTLFFYDSLIKKKEKYQFVYIKDLYHKRVITNLTIQFGNDYFLGKNN